MMAGTIAWAGNAVVTVGGGESGELYLWSQPADTNQWNKQTVSSGSFDGPQIAWTGGSVVVTAVADPQNPNPNVSQGSLYYWWGPLGANLSNNIQLVWTPPVGGLYAYPSIAWTGNSVVITASNPPASLDFWWQLKGTSEWNHEFVAIVPPGPGLYGYYFPAIAWTGVSGGSVVIVAPDDQGNLYYWSQPAGGTTWPPPQLVGTASAGNHFGPPSVAWTGSSVVITAAETPGTTSDPPPPQGGNLHYWWGDGASGIWNPEPVASGNYVNPSIVWMCNSVGIAAVNASGDSQFGNLDFFWQQAGASNWNSQTVAAGSYGFPFIAWTGSNAVIVDGGGHFWWQGPPPWNMETIG
jgi:hypothetical protein